MTLPDMSEPQDHNERQQPTQDGEEEHEVISPREAQIRSLGQDFADYTADGNFSVYLKVCHNREEAENDIRSDSFFPDFVHQFFVNQERIFGYKRPILRIFYTAGRLKRYIKFDYDDKLTREKDGIDADDVMDNLSPILEGLEYTQDLNQFIKEVSSKEEEQFRPPGDLLYEFEVDYKKPMILSRAQKESLEERGELDAVTSQNGDRNSNGCSTNGKKSQNGDELKPTQAPSSSTSGLTTTMGISHQSGTCKKKFQIFHANGSTKGFEQFQAQMQTLVMWFIESATMIDMIEDPKWDCFMIFEKYNPTTSEDPGATPVSTEDRYYFAGYATVYRYYAYPDRTRPRVSQVLILPPYKRNGLGTTLLQSIYSYYKKQPATLDITAEDPDEEFISMRDLLDCANCQELPCFEPEKLKGGWTEEMAKEAQDKLKLCRRQTRKVYEILRLKYTDKSDEEQYKNYRLEIKNRLNIPTRNLKINIDRALKLNPNFTAPEVPQDRVTAVNLEDNYRLLEKQYEHIIDKLNHRKAVA